MKITKTYLKQIIKEETQKVFESSKYSYTLSNLVSKDQELRNKFADMMKQEGGWSQELVNKFIKKYKTKSDDVFGTEEAEKEFLKLEPSLDYKNFSDKDWDNFWLLSQHMDRYPDFQKKSLNTILKYKGKESNLYKQLLLRIGSKSGIIKTNNTIPINLDKINDMGIDWDEVSKKI